MMGNGSDLLVVYDSFGSWFPDQIKPTCGTLLTNLHVHVSMNTIVFTLHHDFHFLDSYIFMF